MSEPLPKGEPAGAGGPAAWDAGLYDRSFGFVSAFATDMVELLAPEPGERIVDLGCGTGHADRRHRRAWRRCDRHRRR